jgi:hypothetical protein
MKCEEYKIHHLKIKPEFFVAVRDNKKTFEIRKNDRNFKVGDILNLREFVGEFTGRETFRKVMFITDYMQKENYVVLGMEIYLPKHKPKDGE